MGYKVKQNTEKHKKITCHEADRLIYKRWVLSPIEAQIITTIIAMKKEKTGQEQRKREKGLLLSAVANEISSVDQSEIMIQGMAS